MLKNYFITAYRNLLRKRTSTFFNVSGLTLGIAGSIVLFLLVNWMLSFDTFQQNYTRIYRVVTDEKSNGGDEFHTPGVPTVLPVAFRNDFGVAAVVALTFLPALTVLSFTLAESWRRKPEPEPDVLS